MECRAPLHGDADELISLVWISTRRRIVRFRFPAEAMAGFRENFDVNALGTGSSALIDRGDDFLDVFFLCGFDGCANAAIEVPKIHTFGERFFSFTFQVFAHVRFDLLDDARCLVAGDDKRK